jgi:Transcriptional regulatory protein, C terminal
MRDALDLHAVSPSPEVTLPVRFAGLVVSLDACMLTRDSGEAIPLTRGEFALLRMFVTRPGRVISRDTLLDAFTNRRFEPFDRSIDVLIGRLRRKVETDPKTPRLIVTCPVRATASTGWFSSRRRSSSWMPIAPETARAPAPLASPSLYCRSPISAEIRSRSISRMA